ncbi:hypothetical protein F5Y12DRAFT_795620 [Xylaria sp. FL1777]|nr:hypothetical protein F5Y12DRAFT_795620 [Xylaria sp. FL1777]
MVQSKRKLLLPGNGKRTQQISNPLGRIELKDVELDQSYLLPFRNNSVDKPLWDLTLSVQNGSFDDLDSLLRSIYGRPPQLSDDFPISSQTTFPRTILADTALYRAWTPRATALMSGRIPPDSTEPWLWNSVIAPRIANVLLRMAKNSWPSGLEISAYLHMVLIDFISGQQSPKVTIEKRFGSFLVEDAPRDVEWDNSIINSKPRFLILRRGEELLSSYHWYVIIIDTDARKAYCFDSKVDQHSRADHGEDFALLQKQWAARISQIPPPDQLIELPSFLQTNDYSSGFISIYHVMLLFRKPLDLRSLEHGSVTMRQECFDYIIKSAEKHIGLRIRKS